MVSKSIRLKVTGRQDPGSVGAALRTISLRLRGTSTKELEEAGEDTTGVVESKSKLRTKIQGYTGVDILTDTGAYKSTYEILLEISKVWDDLTDTDQAGLLELIAGKTRSNTAAAILSNGEDLKDALLAAQEAEGSALAENEKYLDSIQGKLDQFNNAVQTMWSNTLDSGVVKAIVDLGTGLVKIVDKLGLINTLVFGVMTYLSVIKKDKLDFASLLGIHDIDKGWTFGKEGLTGKIAKLFKKDNSGTDTQEIFKEFASEQMSLFDEDVQMQVNLNEKVTQLDKAKRELQELRSTKFENIQIPDDALEYQIGNRRKTYLNEVLIPNKQAEIQALEKDIDDITKVGATKVEQAKVSLLESADGQLSFNFDGMPQSKGLSKYLDIFENGLPQGAEKLTYDTQQLGVELDKLSNMDNSGIINYMSSLDDLGDVGDDTKRVLAGYASTVQDGNYTLQGAQQYVNNYNQKLKQTSAVAKKAQLQQAMLNLAISGLTMVLTSVITKIVEAATNGQKKFDKLNSQLSETESNLKDINSQLDETKNRIQELQEQGVLTFADREELDRLRALNDELERQKQLTESIHKQQQKGVNETSIDAANQYKKVGRNSGKTTGEKAGSGALTGTAIGGAVASTALMATGGAAGLATALGVTGATQAWNPVGWGLLIAAGIVAIGAAIGAGIGAASGAIESKVGESMENMREEHEKLQEKYEKKRQKFAEKGGSGRRKRMEEASEELAEYESMMAEHFAEMDQYYSSIDLSVYDEVKDAETIERLRTEMNEFYDTRDKWLIQSGGANAKSNAISRIFGENASQELKDIKKKIQDAIKAGEEFDFSGAFDGDFKQRLYAMGLTVTDVKYYFQELKKAEDEAAEFSTEDAVKAVAGLADKVESLKGAFEEFNETGIVTAKTLVSLSETFGNMGDKWTDFVGIMTSGTASTEEAKAAINDLIETLITSALSGEKIGTEQYVALWSQLTNLGVKNATEILDGIKEYSSIGEEIANEVINSEKTVEQAIADYEKANGVLLTEEQKQVVRATYDTKTAQQKADTYKTQANTLTTLASEYERVTEAEKEWEDEVENAENTKSGRFLGFLWKVQNDTDKERETNAILSEEEAQKQREAIEKQIESLYSQVFGDAGTATDTDARILELQTFFAEPNNYDELSDEAQAALDELGDQLGLEVDFEFEDPSKLVDDIQGVFDTLANAVKEYNENGYLTVDTAQALTDPDNIDPKYLTLLKDENGQLSLTKENLYRVAVARLTDLKIKRQDAILTDAENLAKNGSIEALRESSDVLYGEADALQTVNKERLKTIRGILEERQAKGELVGFDIDNYMTSLESQIDATGNIFDSAISNIQNSFSSSGNTVTAEVEDAFQNLMDYWDNRISANQAKYDQIQNDIDWLESQGKMADVNYYKDQIDLLTEGEESKEAFLEAKLQGAKDRLGELEAAGKEGSDEWWEAAQIYNDTLSELDDVRDTVIDLQDAIGEIEWSKFEELNNRIDDVNSKLETMRDLIAPDGEEDWFDDEGNWTEKGVAVLGSYVQSLEYYKNGLNEASKALETFQSKEYNETNAKWFAETYGIHSEQEYYDYLQKLTDEQYNYASSVSDTEQDIAGMWESQVDAVEEYFGTLIESYNDYIDSVKEALDAERDLYDFKKKIQKQTKDINSLERRIASLSGSTNAADIAERRKLEAELYESRESLNDEYYNHSKESQQEALDAESQAYEETMNKFVENLRINLDLALQDMDGFIAGVTATVTANAPLILDEYGKLGIALDSAIVAPWQAAKDAMKGYTEADGLGLMNSWVAEGGVFSTFSTNATAYLTSIWTNTNVDPNNAFSNAVSSKVSSIVTNIKSNVETAKGYLNDLYSIRDSSVNYTGGGSGGSTAGNAKPNLPPLPPKVGRLDDRILSKYKLTSEQVSALGYGPISLEEFEKLLKNYQIKYSAKYKQVANTRDIERTSKKVMYGEYVSGPMAIRQYAKGTTGTPRDEWAITDEFGPELILHADPTTGRLQYLTKGSGVIPSELTEELMDLGKIGVDGLMHTNKFGANINMISNAINKPEIVIDVENFLKVDRVDKDTLPQLEAMMDKKIDMFAKQLNYSIKKFSR